MRSTKIAALFLGVGALVAATPSFAGCWVVTQGIYSHIECDKAGVRPTFETFKDTIREMSGVSSGCKRTILKTASSYIGCGVAIASAIKSGGATVWVGAGEACYEFSQLIKDNQEECREYVNLRTKPIKAHVCNGRSTKIDVAIARREVMEEKVTSGWFILQPGECRDFAYANARVLYAMALVPGGGRILPKYNSNDLDDKATFCVNKRSRHDNLNVKTCHARTDQNPYDYDKPGNLKFTNFGRVSGLRGGFTFR